MNSDEDITETSELDWVIGPFFIVNLCLRRSKHADNFGLANDTG